MKVSKTILIMCVLFLCGCANDAIKKEKRIDDYIHSRLESYTRNQEEKCLSNIEIAATKAVDIYIRENEDKILRRSRSEPLPPKPIPPARKRIADSLKIMPIILETKENDI